MQETNKMRDQLINEFAENYMEKLFYFCLKKTGNTVEAEDLTQDISLQIITALNKGTIPTSFSAWVWQIARNRYSVWAKEKHNRNESVTGDHIGDYEIEDESENILDEMIHTEQMALLCSRSLYPQQRQDPRSKLWSLNLWKVMTAHERFMKNTDLR